MDDRRAHPRYTVREVGTLRLVDSESSKGEQSVYVEDASLGGLGVFLDRKIPVDALVRVSVSGVSLIGKVVYCRGKEDGFAAGVRLIGNSDSVHKLLASHTVLS